MAVCSYTDWQSAGKLRQRPPEWGAQCSWTTPPGPDARNEPRFLFFHSLPRALLPLLWSPPCLSVTALPPPTCEARLFPPPLSRRLCAVRGTSEEAQGSSLAEGFPKICFPPTPPDCSLKSRSEEPGCSHWENWLEKRLGLAVALQHPTFLQSHTWLGNCV